MRRDNTMRIICTALAVMMLTGCGSSVESSEAAAKAGTSETSVTDKKTQTDTTTTTTVTEQTTTTEAVTEPDDESSEQIPSDLSIESYEAVFEEVLDGVEVTADENRIVETGNVQGTDFSLTIDLSKWEHYTTPYDMRVLSRLFWQNYPKLYRRYGDITGAPTDVTLAIENEGYEIAEAGGSLVHLHDQWLYSSPEDYDCITHELAHIAQDGVSWYDENLEYSYYTELFVDCARYEYALDNGYYNDHVWTLHTPDEETDRSGSVRFFVWLDYNYSTKDNDLMRKFCSIAYNGAYAADDWAGAWEEILSGTELEGLSIDEVWDRYAQSGFAYMSAYADAGEKSELLESFDIRQKADELAAR